MEKLDFVRKINICLRIRPKQIATFLCSSGWLNTANRHLISFMESTSGNAHTDMVSLWYEFLRDFFAKPLQNSQCNGFSLVWVLIKCGTPSA